MKPSPGHVYRCTAPDGRRVEVAGAPDRDAAERRAAEHFGCDASVIISRYVKTVCGLNGRTNGEKKAANWGALRAEVSR